MAKRPIPKSSNELLFDRHVRHATFIDRLTAREKRLVTRVIVREVIPGLTERGLAAASANATASRARKLAALAALEAEFRSLAATGLSAERSRFIGAMRDLAELEAEFVVNAFRVVTPADIAISYQLPATATIRQIADNEPIRGQLLRSWFDGLGRSTADDVSKAIRLGVLEGQSVPEMRRAVANATGVAKNRAEAVVRTAVTNVTARARETTYDENTSVIKGVQYVATLDSRTTIVCAGLDGQVFPINDGPRPPQHINCRSTTVPVLRSWEELGIPANAISPSTRASMNGQVPASTTFNGWLKDQPRGVQNEVLGPTRASLWREGKIELTKFTDGGRLLDLNTLRKREGLSLRDIQIAN
ncbi:MAG: hypothetical protein CMJ75_18605 [Planctomycetaceae bacterium]|nr:hypothetical protein [Planctomycetaceae bacterium]